MTRDELLAAVPVHRQGGGAFVVLAEIPLPWRDQFASALRGSAAPRIDGEGPCAWAWDWQQWVAGTWHQRPGPDGLTKWVIDGVEVERSSGNVFADLGLPEPEKLLRASRAHGQMVLVIDLEATCCDEGTIPPESMEIIEVGAAWATPSGEVIDTLQRFVRPSERPTLTPFCMGLTHIEQASIDAAPSWPAVAAELAEFARLHAGQCWGSWGKYDRRQIERETARHGLVDPLAGLPHHNLKAAFAKRRKIKQVGMATALQIVGLELEGEHHRALSDARNIARMLPWALG